MRKLITFNMNYIEVKIKLSPTKDVERGIHNVEALQCFGLISFYISQAGAVVIP